MTAVGRPARPRLPKLRSLPPLRVARRCGATCSSRPWLIGFFLFTLAPMIASLAFTFSNIALDQQEPLAFVGLRNWQTLLGDGQAWESLAVTFRFALFQLPFIMVMPFLLAIGLNSRNLKGPGAFRVLFFLPVRDPVRLGRPHLAGDAQPRDRLDQPVPASSWASRTRPTGSTTAR